MSSSDEERATDAGGVRPTPEGINLFFLFNRQLLEAQADYHRRSLAALEAALPTIQLQQGEQNA